MSDVLATLALSVVFGIAATIGFYFVGELSSAQSIFLGFLVTAVLAPVSYTHLTLPTICSV